MNFKQNSCFVFAISLLRMRIGSNSCDYCDFNHKSWFSYSILIMNRELYLYFLLIYEFFARISEINEDIKH